MLVADGVAVVETPRRDLVERTEFGDTTAPLLLLAHRAQPALRPQRAADRGRRAARHPAAPCAFCRARRLGRGGGRPSAGCWTRRAPRHRRGPLLEDFAARVGRSGGLWEVLRDAKEQGRGSPTAAAKGATHFALDRPRRAGLRRHAASTSTGCPGCGCRSLRQGACSKAMPTRCCCLRGTRARDPRAAVEYRRRAAVHRPDPAASDRLSLCCLTVAFTLISAHVARSRRGSSRSSQEPSAAFSRSAASRAWIGCPVSGTATLLVRVHVTHPRVRPGIIEEHEHRPSWPCPRRWRRFHRRVRCRARGRPRSRRLLVGSAARASPPRQAGRPARLWRSPRATGTGRRRLASAPARIGSARREK